MFVRGGGGARLALGLEGREGTWGREGDGDALVEKKRPSTSSTGDGGMVVKLLLFNDGLEFSAKWFLRDLTEEVERPNKPSDSRSWMSRSEPSSKSES